jgi:hypothetical protein
MTIGVELEAQILPTTTSRGDAAVSSRASYTYTVAPSSVYWHAGLSWIGIVASFANRRLPSAPQ